MFADLDNDDIPWNSSIQQGCPSEHILGHLLGILHKYTHIDAYTSIIQFKVSCLNA